MGTGRFAGPRLKDLIQRTGLRPTGKHVMFAMDADTLVATQMNGAALTKHHGFPARALIPGWVGAASCKWLTEIKVLDKEFDGNFMKPAYRMPNEPVKPGEPVNPDVTHPLTALTVKSLIASPSDGATLKKHAIQIHGTAWAGEADIARVDISTDSGATWQQAQLGNDQAHYAWRLWSYNWKPTRAGDYLVMSRATDSQGRAQPQTAVWNPSGYLYNAIDRVKFHVQA